ncbi:hypothetical protein [Deferrisoma sp.]
MSRSSIVRFLDGSGGVLAAGGALLATGAAYGAALAWTQRALAVPVGGLDPAEVPFRLLLVGHLLGGLGAVAAAHLGATFVLWLMARAAGGPGGFGRLYRAGAVLLLAGLPALPAVAHRALAPGHPLGPGLALPAAAAALALVAGAFAAFRLTQGFGPGRAAAATALATVFAGALALL